MIAARLEAVRERLRRACERAGRAPNEVELVAVSKRHPPSVIEAAYEAGQRRFGENYLQELEEKAAALSHLPELRFQFIGHLQRNKAKRAMKVASAIDTLDSARLAEALNRHGESAGVTRDVLIQVNVAGEGSKAGIELDALDALVEVVSKLPNLRLRGLMTLPPVDESEARRAFEALAEARARLGLEVLSMGMSADLELAVACGSTQVRVGTAIFGPRP
ncbi:MAG: YggS family pyridoxal phosphate-dependent enzyme [Myxococcota bacterium]